MAVRRGRAGGTVRRQDAEPNERETARSATSRAARMADVTVVPPEAGRLLALAQRAQRTPLPRVALVLHLSRLASPRLAHRRIALAVVQEAAERLDGQIFPLHSGDVVLVCQDTASDLAGLAQTLARLFRAATADGRAPISIFALATDAAALADYAAAQAGAAQQSLEEDPSCPPGTVDEIEAALTPLPLPTLLRRQSIIRLLRTPGGGRRLQPIAHEIGYAAAAWHRHHPRSASVLADPGLSRHLGERLDQRLLVGLTAALGTGQPLDAVRAQRAGPGYLLRMTLTSVVSERFLALVAACRPHEVRLGISLSFVDACADPGGYARARAALAEAGFLLLLGAITPTQFALTRPWTLQPDMLAIDLPPGATALGGAEAERLAQALGALGPERVVLRQLGSAAALEWGLGQGVELVQGAHVEAMLAAQRMQVCPHASGCSFRQCTDRAASLDEAGRRGCTNPVLLDQAGSAPRPKGTGPRGTTP